MEERRLDWMDKHETARYMHKRFKLQFMQTVLIWLGQLNRNAVKSLRSVLNFFKLVFNIQEITSVDGIG